MTIALVTDPAALVALGPLWDRLWRDPAAAGAHPFLHPAWLLPWWSVFGDDDGARLRVAIRTRPDGSLAALLPLYEHMAESKLLPLGVGLSDYAGVLQATDAPPDTAARLLAAVLDGTAATRCDLTELPPGDALRDIAAPPGWRADEWAGPTCPVLALRPVPAIPAGMRRDVRQARHRAARAGGYAIRHAGTDAEAAAALDALATLHGARWTERGEPGVLADERVRRFHARAAPRLIAAGLLRLATVTLGSDIAAVVHAVLDRERIHFYLGGFDPARRFESPGTLALAALIEDAAADGRAEAHFLRGAERYKYAWGAVDRFNRGRSIVRA